MLAALHPGVWGAGKLVTGALSDRLGRKWLIVEGMGVQGLALAVRMYETRQAPTSC